jgi:hypothetical protein
VRILFCISAIGRGHVARCRPLLAALQARGHRCAAAVPGRRAAAYLEDLCEVIRPPAGFGRRVRPAGHDDLAHMCVYDLEMAMSVYQADLDIGLRESVAYVAAACEAARPDLVVVDQITVAGPVAAARGLPVAQVSQAPMLPGHGPWMSWLDRPDPAFRYPPALPTLARALARAGLPAPATLEEQLAGDLVVVPTHPAFGTAERALHVRPADALGPLAAAEAPPARSRRPGRPLVAVSLSTATRRLAADVVAGVLAAGGEAIVLDGLAAELPAAQLDEDRVHVLGTVHLPEVLTRCDAIVHHGGSGTTMAALAAGLPTAIVPGDSEQENTARRLAALGAGALVAVSDRPPVPHELRPGLATLVHHRPERLPDRLAAALDAILTDAARSSASQLGRELAALPPIESAVDAVEGLALGRAA